MDKENEIVNAGKPDEFFVCAYHVKNADTKVTSHKQGVSNILTVMKAIYDLLLVPHR